METLLRNDFTAHYGLPISTTANITVTTMATYFELKDDSYLIYTVVGQGIAKYKNDASIKVTVINFESFFNALPLSGCIQRQPKCQSG